MSGIYCHRPAKVGEMLLAGTAFLLLTAACEKDTSTYQERMIFYTALDPSLAHQTVIVDRSYRVDESAPESAGVAGASVRLWRQGADDTLYLDDRDRQGFYQDTLAAFAVQGNCTYCVSVQWQDYAGKDSVTVPDTFRVTRPAASETLSLSNLPAFTWTASAGAAAYVVYMSALNPRRSGPPGRPGESGRQFARPIRTSAESLDLRSQAQTIFDTTGIYRLRVYAVDSHLGQGDGGDLDTIGSDVLASCGALTADSLRFVLLP